MFNCKRCSQPFNRNTEEINKGRVKYCSRNCSDAAKGESAKITAERVLRLGRKQCHMCDKTRILSKFPKSKVNATGYFSYCYDCRRGINREQDARRKYSDKRKLWSRRNYLLRTYGLSLEEYELLEKSQSGGCAICGGTARLAIDHCHKTNKIRGLLCHNCNRGLGMFADDKQRLSNAITYLR